MHINYGIHRLNALIAIHMITKINLNPEILLARETF